MKKIFTLCMVLCAAFTLSAQTVVLSEDFSLITDSTSYVISNLDNFTNMPGWTDTLAYPRKAVLLFRKEEMQVYCLVNLREKVFSEVLIFRK